MARFYVCAMIYVRAIRERLQSESGYTTWEWLGGGAAIAALFLALAAVMQGTSPTQLANAIIEWLAAALNAHRPQ